MTTQQPSAAALREDVDDLQHILDEHPFREQFPVARYGYVCTVQMVRAAAARIERLEQELAAYRENRLVQWALTIKGPPFYADEGCDE